ncbi:T9SS type A sorting domain-containing protein, partial [candidate division WOR-3 bacterium]|nr:T9SS type A sorting domain-containing protein [candidate division WOR-3 bacterium]
GVSEEEYLVEVFPNPCRVYQGENTVTFSGELSAGDNIKIFDMSGKIVHNSGNLSETTYLWSVSEVASGIYLFVVKSTDGLKKTSGKIAVIR